MRKKDRDLLNQRDLDFYNAYKEVIKSKGSDATLITKRALLEMAIEKTAPRFYVSPKQAGVIINKMLREG